MSRYSLFLATTLFVCLSLGCGQDSRVAVTGEVFVEGKLVEKGSITFEPADGVGPSSGGLIEQGKYKLLSESKVTPGLKIVRIKALRKTGRLLEKGPPFPPGDKFEEEESLLPAQFNDRSELRVEIPKQANFEKKFELSLSK